MGEHMPELPDVAQLKRYLDATSLHQEVERVHVQDKRILDGISAARLHELLRGNRFESTRRHGKWLFVRTATTDTIRLHFGMSGSLKYYKNGSAPAHTRVLVDFTNGCHFAYIATRMLGAVGLTRDEDAFIRGKRLGPDALRIDRDTLKRVISERRGTLKSALMNQKVIAGLGNVYSDEVLFQARLHPRSRTAALNDDHLQQLFDAIRHVLNTAIACHADARNLPDDFFTHYRHEGADCPRPGCSGHVKPIRIAGRRAWYCNTCQREIG